ncbi:hypothetical protein WA026_007902 [Henosepilachna vigintioctopunctata]|uniref:Transmembrane protein 183 n=1 Tax=Henosepilachna vigintioctopunctata TaxID=420089 RepID=A0AAW1U4D0_9CUCU
MVKTKKESKNFIIPQDVTLYDFANSRICKSRSKKLVNSVSFVMKKELEVKNSWEDDDEETDEDCATVHNSCMNSQQKQDQTNISKYKSKAQCDNNGNIYPYDIWFLISNFIRPEDVGRFSAICKTCLEVTSSVNFWIALYKRYLRKECLPEELQPECILRYFGLRTSVIKALYLMYHPFILLTRKTFGNIMHPDILKGKQCIGLSLRQEDKKWCYYFKFKLNNPVSFHRNANKNQSIIEILNDIYANSEEDHCLLKIISEELSPIIPIIGQFLKHVTLSLSQGFCAFKLQLTFGSEFNSYTVKNGTIGGNIVVMDSVSKINILNWWHPNYIASKNISLLHQEQ